MNAIIKGQATERAGLDYKIIDADVDLTTSRAAGVWLVDGDDENDPFLMIVGARTEEDAARAYAKRRKAQGHVPPAVYRVFPLVNLEPITKARIVGPGNDADWTAFQNAWVEVRL